MGSSWVPGDLEVLGGSFGPWGLRVPLSMGSVLGVRGSFRGPLVLGALGSREARGSLDVRGRLEVGVSDP